MFLIFFVKVSKTTRLEDKNIERYTILYIIPLTCVRYTVYAYVIPSLTLPQPDGRILAKTRDPLRAGDPVIVNTRCIRMSPQSDGREIEPSPFSDVTQPSPELTTDRPGDNNDNSNIIVYYRIIVDATIVIVTVCCMCYYGQDFNAPINRKKTKKCVFKKHSLLGKHVGKLTVKLGVK